MRYKPTGYRVLIEMDLVENQVQDGALKGFQLTTENQQEREDNGHCVGIIKAFGPTAFLGYEGCENPGDWGVELGDLVEFNRYDGKIPLYDTEKRYRIINDSDILMVIDDE